MVKKKLTPAELEEQRKIQAEIAWEEAQRDVERRQDELAESDYGEIDGYDDCSGDYSSDY